MRSKMAMHSWRRRALLTGVLSVLVLLGTAVVVEATTTSWSCDGGVNDCPSGSKYNRSKLAYTITGGSGSNTDWRFDTRYYGGSNGRSGVSQDKWRLNWGRDFSSTDGQNWTKIGSYSRSNWYSNNNPWRDYTVGSTRTVNDALGISWLSEVQHKQCSPDPITGCSRPDAWRTWERINENTVFN